VDRPISALEGHFIAGFIEGDAHFGVGESNGGQSFRCFMSLRLRDDDAELLEWLRARTGVGRLTPVPARATSKPQVQWLVQTQADCRVLADLLTQFPLRGHRRAEFELWRSAVELWHSPVTHKIVVARRLREKLAARRSFSPPEAGTIAPAPADKTALRGYLHALVAAEGSFELRHEYTGLAVHMRQDSRPLLAMLAAALEVGSLRDHPASPGVMSTFAD
jgi:hypothetical protein